MMAHTPRTPRSFLVLSLLAAAIAAASHPARAEDRSYDGSGNNLTNTTWGTTNVDLLRIAPAAYSDGISTPAGAALASARAISNAVSAHPAAEMPNARNMTAMTYAFGQFLDHDIDLTPTGGTESFNIAVPTGDPSFDPFNTGTQIIPTTRSIYDPLTGTSTSNPRQQVNTISTYIDGSVVYGSDATRAAALRSFSGGKLLTSAGNLLPFNTALLPNANDAHIVADNQLFLAGDVRANENIELTSVQTLFMREHNRLATLLSTAHPTWSDDQLYQDARKIVGAEIQAITYNEFLPTLMGNNALTPYTGYKPTVNAGIANEFSTAAYRFGHSMLANDIDFLDNNGNAIATPISLANAFFNPPVVISSGIEPILKYLTVSPAEEVDTKVVDSVRNFLFGPPGSGGLDLAALNIQRGRDNGLASYNQTRIAYGLAPVTSFAQITSDTALQSELASVYTSVNDIDLWVGGLAEDHLAGSSLGQLLETILADQFERLRDGDRFFYLNDPSLTPLLADIGMSESDMTMCYLITNDTPLTTIQAEAFSIPEPTSLTLLATSLLFTRKNRRRHA